MIRKLASGEYRLYSRKKNPKTGHRRNLGAFAARARSRAARARGPALRAHGLVAGAWADSIDAWRW